MCIAEQYICLKTSGKGGIFIVEQIIFGLKT